ncbi:MAG: hypothetical protein V1756_01400 [Patescibacteria group bacterium]
MEGYGLKVKAIGYEETERGRVLGGCWKKLIVPNHPNKITLRITKGKGDDDGTIFAIKGTKAYTIESGTFFLEVPVAWQNGIPHTREEPNDNVDIVALQGTGEFCETQVGLATRGGAFFVTIQKIWRGWIGFSGSGIEYTPADPEHSYPGSNFKLIDLDKEEVIRLAGTIATEVYTSVGGKTEKHEAVKWSSSLPPEKAGWRRGNILFFNLITGTGLILGEDGERFFVHFRNLPPRDGLVVLAPMQPVYYRPKGETPETGQLRRVKSCLPA